MFLNRLLLEKQPFLTIQEIFYMFFSDFLFCLCFRYFFIILLEDKHILFGLGIIFIFFGPSTAISSSDGISILSPKFISLMTPAETFSLCLLSWYHQTNCLQYICLLFSFCCWKDYFHLARHQLNLKNLLFFLFSCSIVYRINFLFKIKELIVLFLCFYFYCFSILNLWFNVGMFNSFMFERLK